MTLPADTPGDRYTPKRSRLDWPLAHRIVSSRFPPVGAFDGIAAPADIDALHAIEGLTNPRLREQAGTLTLVPPTRRSSGSGTSPVMAAFAHPNPAGSRFSDGSYGVFYAAHALETAVKETMHHKARFLAATAEPAMKVEMRVYRVAIRGRVHELRRGVPPAQARALLAPDDYTAGQALALQLRDAGADGIVYPSVRHAGGECVAAFYPDLITSCRQHRHLIYSWDGRRIDPEYAVASLRLAP